MNKEQFSNEWGLWQKEGNGVVTLIEPSQKWIDENQPNKPEPEPEPKPNIKDLQTEVEALKTQNTLLEDCIIELAQVVYA